MEEGSALPFIGTVPRKMVGEDIKKFELLNVKKLFLGSFNG